MLIPVFSLLSEVERVRKEGFTAKELENVRNNIRSDLLAVSRDHVSYVLINLALFELSWGYATNN